MTGAPASYPGAMSAIYPVKKESSPKKRIPVRQAERTNLKVPPERPCGEQCGGLGAQGPHQTGQVFLPEADVDAPGTFLGRRCRSSEPRSSSRASR